MFLSLPQLNIKIPQTFKFVTVEFTCIIIAPFLKSLSQPCLVIKVWPRKSLKTQLSSPYIYIFIYIPITLQFTYMHI
jgi:hypothetical protein